MAGEPTSSPRTLGANCPLPSDLSFAFEKTFSLFPSTQGFRGDGLTVSRLWLPEARAVSLRVEARPQGGRQEVMALLGPGERGACSAAT